MDSMKIGVSLPEDLLAFADQAARRRGTSRSELLAHLLEAERVRQQTREYLDRHGWDVVDDEAAWRRHQRRRMAEEYGDDDRRPVVVVQTDKVREPRVRSFLVVPLTSRLHLEGLPGNVRLSRADTRLPKASVANLYDLQKVLRSDFLRRLSSLPASRLAVVADSLRLVLDL